MRVYRTFLALLQIMDDVGFYCCVGSFPMFVAIEYADKHERQKIARGWGPGTSGYDTGILAEMGLTPEFYERTIHYF